MPRGGGAKSGGALPKPRILCPKTAFFDPKQPRNPFKTTKRRETVATLHVRLDCPVAKSPLLPSNSTICPRNGPKMAKNGPKCALFVSNRPKTKNGLYIGLCGRPRQAKGTPERVSAGKSNVAARRRSGRGRSRRREGPPWARKQQDVVHIALPHASPTPNPCPALVHTCNAP